MSSAENTALLGGRPVDAGHLEALGKTAARMYGTSRVTLNDAVVQTLGREKLNSEQIRRVVEFANVTAFNTKFASLAGTLRAVSLDGGPADPVQVIQSLHANEAPVAAPVSSDYMMPPSFASTKSASATTGIYRTAEGALMEVLDLQTKLSAAHDNITQSLEANKFVMNECMVDLTDRAKRAALQGATPDEIYEAWATVHPELAKVAFARTGMSLRGDKVAHVRTINPEQPVVQSFAHLVKTSGAYMRDAEALRNIEAELVRVNTWIQHRGEAS